MSNRDSRSRAFETRLEKVKEEHKEFRLLEEEGNEGRVEEEERLVRNQWKKELLGQSERTVEDFRTEIFKKLKSFSKS